MEKIQVEIFGQTYFLKGGADAGYVRELARFVDGKMKELQKGTGTGDGYRLAILTALNIADELHRVRTDHGELNASVRASVDRIMNIISDEINGAER